MLMNLSVYPVGSGASLSKLVAEAINEIDRSGLDYRLTSMSTIVEGDWESLMKLANKIREKLMKKVDRVILTITIDDKKDRRRRIESRVKSIEDILGKTLRK